MSGIGAAIGYFLGPLMLAHYPPWVGGLAAGAGAAILWGLITLIAALVKAPGKLLREKDAALQAAQEKLSATNVALAEAGVRMETAQHEHAAKVEVLRYEHSKEIEAIRQEHANAIEALRRERESAAVLAIRAFTDSLGQSWGAAPVDKLTAGFIRRRFAVLSVTNEAAKNLVGIVATCQFSGGNAEYGIWSATSGEAFAPGGSYAADLNVGDTKLLVVAEGFGADSIWVRLPPAGQALHELPMRATYGLRSVSYLDRSGNGNILDLGADVPVSVRFRAEGLDQTKHFRLWFNQGEPAIDAVTAPPPADQPSTMGAV